MFFSSFPTFKLFAKSHPCERLSSRKAFSLPVRDHDEREHGSSLHEQGSQR